MFAQLLTLKFHHQGKYNILVNAESSPVACQTTLRYFDIVLNNTICLQTFPNFPRSCLINRNSASKHQICCETEDNYHKNLQFIAGSV
jgi:hypothetical protein